MTEAIASAPASEKSAKRTGWALLALALASPILMSAAGVISAGKAGELAGQAGFAWLAAAIVIDLLTRKRDATTKANGRILAAAAALVLAGTAIYTDYRDNRKVDTAKKELTEQLMASLGEARNAPAQASSSGKPDTANPAPLVPAPAGASDADKTVSVLAAMTGQAKKFSETSAALDRKFYAVDMTQVLSPQNLLSSEGIKASRATLATFKGLVRERGAMLTNHFAFTEQIVRSAGLSQGELANGLAGIEAGKEPVQKTYGELDTVQFAFVKASEDLVNFAERGLGRITVQDGQFMFQTQPELDEYRRLMRLLTDAAAKEGEVSQRVNAFAQQTKQNMVNQLK